MKHCVTEVYSDELFENPPEEGAMKEEKSDPIMEFFEYEHLPIQLKVVSSRLSKLAYYLHDSIPNSPEKTEGLRKLLEAKDCFVRAAFSYAKSKESTESP